MKSTILFLIGILAYTSSFAQDDLASMLDEGKQKEYTKATFKTSRLINLHSNETVRKHELDFRVDHSFGDIVGNNGGYQNYFGLTTIADFKLGFEYGVNDRLTIATGLSKGQPKTLMLDAYAKYKLLQQTTDNAMPIGITLISDIACATVKPSSDATSPNSYNTLTQRLSYNTQAIIVRKFNSNFSAAIIPGVVHNNYVAYGYQNMVPNLGMGLRYKLTKRFGIVLDYAMPFYCKTTKDYLASKQIKLYNPLGVGIEIETGGHIFHVNFTNKESLLEQQFIPNTTSNWLAGQFRWGFNISRTFSLF